uniref:Uncharacterized protein n=1 Tax=Moniliophthora roreri TaxID=221103 RepID=A0A0W0FHR7_MONRR
MPLVLRSFAVWATVYNETIVWCLSITGGIDLCFSSINWGYYIGVVTRNMVEILCLVTFGTYEGLFPAAASIYPLGGHSSRMLRRWRIQIRVGPHTPRS